MDDERCFVEVDRVDVADGLHRGGFAFDVVYLTQRCGGDHPYVKLERHDERKFAQRRPGSDRTYWLVPLLQINGLIAALQKARDIALEKYGARHFAEHWRDTPDQRAQLPRCPAHRGRR